MRIRTTDIFVIICALVLIGMGAVAIPRYLSGSVYNALPTQAVITNTAPQPVLAELTEACLAVAPISHQIDDDSPERLFQACAQDAEAFYALHAPAINECHQTLGNVASALSWSACFKDHGIVMPQDNRDALLGRR